MLLDCKTALITNYFFATCLFPIWVVWVVSLMQRMMFVFSFFCLRERGCHNHSKLGPLLDFLLDCITSQECQHILFLLYFSVAQLENAKEWNNKSHTNWLWRFPFLKKIWNMFPFSHSLHSNSFFWSLTLSLVKWKRLKGRNWCGTFFIENYGPLLYKG